MCAFLERKHTEDVDFPWTILIKVKFYSDFEFFIFILFIFFLNETALLAVKASLYMFFTCLIFSCMGAGYATTTTTNFSLKQQAEVR